MHAVFFEKLLAEQFESQNISCDSENKGLHNPINVIDKLNENQFSINFTFTLKKYNTSNKMKTF
jgi:hypothetical protein